MKRGAGAALFGGDSSDDEDAAQTAAALRRAERARKLEELKAADRAAPVEAPVAPEPESPPDAPAPAVQGGPPKRSRYIGKLVQQAERRKVELDEAKSRYMLKERLKDDEEHAGKEKFVTRAYQRELDRRASVLDEIKRQDERDAAEGTNLAGFYGAVLEQRVTGQALHDAEEVVPEDEVPRETATAAAQAVEKAPEPQKADRSSKIAAARQRYLQRRQARSR